MVWGCFSSKGVGPICRINGVMDQHKYLEIMREVMEPYTDEVMPINWIYQQDNDPKHTAKTVKQWFRTNGINVMDWPSCSPDLNPIENLWAIVKRDIAKENFTNLDNLYEGIKKSLYSIPVEKCINIIQTMPKRCEEVLKNNGFPLIFDKCLSAL